MSTPEIRDDPLYQLLRHGKVEEFNEQIRAGATCDLTGADLRGLDLRGMIADGLDLSDSYLRQSDLRGIDFRNCNIRGTSLFGAKISGTYFPKELRAEEITLSLLHGIRIRYEG